MQAWCMRMYIFIRVQSVVLRMETCLSLRHHGVNVHAYIYESYMFKRMHTRIGSVFERRRL